MLASATDETNIYAGHPQLTPLEADVLWEYAKLSRTLKAVLFFLVTKSREMTEHSDDALLAKLRAAEMKMGLVHTLFKASVWAVLVKQEEEFNGEEGETTFQP
ncbi:DASH complex subunit Dad3, partial [Rhizoctonia solani]